MSADKPISNELSDLDPDDTLFVHLQATSGDLKSILLLNNYSKKPIRVANLNGQADNASFEQDFSEGGANYSLDLIAATPNGKMTSGDFKLQVGLNAPEVLEGEGQAKLIAAIQEEVKAHPSFQKAILVLDESAEEKAGLESVGAGRQYNGRLKKPELGWQLIHRVQAQGIPFEAVDMDDLYGRNSGKSQSGRPTLPCAGIGSATPLANYPLTLQ